MDTCTALTRASPCRMRPAIVSATASSSLYGGPSTISLMCLRSARAQPLVAQQSPAQPALALMRPKVLCCTGVFEKKEGLSAPVQRGVVDRVGQVVAAARGPQVAQQRGVHHKALPQARLLPAGRQGSETRAPLPRRAQGISASAAPFPSTPWPSRDSAPLAARHGGRRRSGRAGARGRRRARSHRWSTGARFAAQPAQRLGSSPGLPVRPVRCRALAVAGTDVVHLGRLHAHSRPPTWTSSRDGSLVQTLNIITEGQATR
jgi:hypothetical protein